jgi:hypothetical protein
MGKAVPLSVGGWFLYDFKDKLVTIITYIIYVQLFLLIL